MPVEQALIVEANARRDLRLGHPAREQLLREGDATVGDVGVRRETHLLVKGATQPELVEPGVRRERIEAHILGVALVEELAGARDRGAGAALAVPGLVHDVDERAHWADYMEAYQAALERTSTAHAPWFVVPADNKWYARLAVTNLLLEHLEAMDPQWPAADFDVEAEKARLALTP